MARFWCLSALLAVAVGCTQNSPPSTSVTTEKTPVEAIASEEPQSGDVQLVTLSLPNMTCPICAKEVRNELAQIEGLSDVETDVKANTCKFKLADKDLDLQSKLDELAAGNESLKGFKVVKK